MAPVDEPDAKVRIRVDSFDPFWPNSMQTKSKWCLDPTNSLTTLEGTGLDEKGGLPAVEPSAKRPHPLSSNIGLLEMGDVLLQVLKIQN